MTGHPPESVTQRLLAGAILELMTHVVRDHEGEFGLLDVLAMLDEYVTHGKPVPAELAKSPLFRVVRAILRHPAGKEELEGVLSVIYWAQSDE